MERNRALVDQTVAVLVESYRLKPDNVAGTEGAGQWTGRTSTNKIVHLPADIASTGQGGNVGKGSLVQVVIKRALAHSLWGLPTGPGNRTVRRPKGESSHAA